MHTENTLRRIQDELKRRLLNTVRWWPEAAVLVVVALFILHKVYPPIVEWIGERLGVEPSLAILVTLLLVAVFVLERIVDLKEHLEPSVTLYDNREDAYEAFALRLRNRRARKVDLLQFSGHTAQGVLKALAERSPKAKVRMLLFDAALADTFDTDGELVHSGRIQTVKDQIGLIENQNPDFKVEIRSYNTSASVSAIILDDKVICLSWYHVFRDRKILRIRGHRSPTVTFEYNAAHSFLEFGKDHFARLWGPDEPAG